MWHDSCVCSRSPLKSHENSPTIAIFVYIYCFSLYIRWLRWCLLQLHLPVLSFCRLEIITEAHVSLKTEGSSMGMPKPSSTLLLLLLIVTVSASQKQITSEARTLLSQKQSKYISLFILKALSQWWFLIDWFFSYLPWPCNSQNIPRFFRHWELFASVVMKLELSAQLLGRVLAIISNVFHGRYRLD